MRTLCQISSSSFASGSFDKTIKIWDIYNFECIYTILGHKDLILIIIRIKTGEIISCSNDHEIKIWKQLNNWFYIFSEMRLLLLYFGIYFYTYLILL